MREAIIMLQEWLGLSNVEASRLVGVTDRTWSRWRQGQVEPESGDVIATLEHWRSVVMEMAGKASVRHREMVAAHGIAERSIILIYLNDSDVPPDRGWPCASLQRKSARLIMELIGEECDVVAFNRASYEAWRGGRPDNYQSRLHWAAGGRRMRFAFKIGVNSIGWAAITGAGPAAVTVIAAGDD